MTEAEWLGCTDPTPMVGLLTSTASDRKLRLFACACCRRIWHLLSVEIGRSAVLAAELHADGLIGDEDLKEARFRAEGAHVSPLVPDSAAYCTTWVDTSLLPTLRIVLGVDDAAVVAAEFCDDYAAERICQAAVVRDISGNPFRPVSVRSSWVRWNDSTVVKLAHAIYDNRAFDRLPILADALEEAGCDNADIMGHLRGPGPHVRGCWVIDLLLGKK